MAPIDHGLEQPKRRDLAIELHRLNKSTACYETKFSLRNMSSADLSQHGLPLSKRHEIE